MGKVSDIIQSERLELHMSLGGILKVFSLYILCCWTLNFRDADVLALMRDSITELLFSLDLKEDPVLIWPALLALSIATSKWAPHEVCQRCTTCIYRKSGFFMSLIHFHWYYNI